MQIIKHGDIHYKEKKYRFNCCGCGCEFIADVRDMQPHMGRWGHEMYYTLSQQEPGYKVNCPDCKELLTKPERDYIGRGERTEYPLA